MPNCTYNIWDINDFHKYNLSFDVKKYDILIM